MKLTKSYATGPKQPELRDITIGELLREVAQQNPDQVALIAGVSDKNLRRQWTYSQLFKQAQQVAYALLQRFAPGEHIAVMAPNIPEWIILEYGAALSGTVLVTVNPSYQSSEIEYVLKQSQSSGIFVLSEFRGNQILQAVESVKANCPKLREIIQFDQWNAFIESGDDTAKSLPNASPSDPVMIQYTSGTTGFPKGALLHHRGLVNNSAHMFDCMGVDEGGIGITMVPLFHTAGSVACVLGALSKRATQVLVDSFDPELVLELIESYKATFFIGVPTMIIALLEHPDSASRDLSTVTQIAAGGSTVPAALVKRFEEELGASFTVAMAQTESSPVISMTRHSDSVKDKAKTVGYAIPHVEIKIIDPENGEILPINTMGEYCTRGYHVMHGYYDMPEQTASTIDQEGWLHTGDLCSMDERGYCKVEGRLKDMIIRGGENIYPREIEDLLFKEPSVGEAAVVGVADDLLGEVVAVFIRPAPDQTLDKDKLFAYLRKHLSPQKTPKYWYKVEQFPMTASGKIQKFALRDLWDNGELELL